MKPIICILSFSYIERDARVLRQIKYLKDYYNITVIGFGNIPAIFANEQGITWRLIEKDLSAGMPDRVKGWFTLTFAGRLMPTLYESWYWSKTQFQEALRLAKSSGCQAFHANDWNALPVAAEAAKTLGAYLVFDAHEYSPLQFENIWIWRFLYRHAIIQMLKRYAPAVDKSMTVAPRIAERYRRESNLDPIIVLNAPDRVVLPERQVSTDENIRLIHHGGNQRSRKLENMIKAVALARPQISLDLMLVNGDPPYYDYLKELAKSLAPDRIRVIDPVPPDQIILKIADYDMGISIFNPRSYNQFVALPNKFFDFINAGLAICTGPSPSMKEIVEQYRIGCVTPSFEPEDVAHTLNQLNRESITAMQAASRQAAEVFNAETEMKKVVQIYQEYFS